MNAPKEIVEIIANLSKLQVFEEQKVEYSVEGLLKGTSIVCQEVGTLRSLAAAELFVAFWVIYKE